MKFCSCLRLIFDVLFLFEIVHLKDCPSADLGIHKLLSLAVENIGLKAVGRWYTPTEAISLIRYTNFAILGFEEEFFLTVIFFRTAVRNSTSPLTSGLSVLLCVDGVLKRTDAEVCSGSWTKSVIAIVTLRLGATDFNTVGYQKAHIH